MGYKNLKSMGFTLIELMIVMTIMALLMGLVGPLAISSVEKAQAKQETLSFKNFLRKVGARAFYTGHPHVVKLVGKQINLFIQVRHEEKLIESINYDFLFFQPQTLLYNTNGFVEPDKVSLTYRDISRELQLAFWVNGQNTDIVPE